MQSIITLYLYNNLQVTKSSYIFQLNLDLSVLKPTAHSIPNLPHYPLSLKSIYFQLVYFHFCFLSTP